MKKIALLLYVAMVTTILTAQKADLIIFSFDRPLQLYALLESTQRYVKNVGEIHVIYRSSNERYQSAYRKVFKHFASIVPIKQGDNPATDFKPLLLKSFFETPHEYILFAVDDIVVRDYIDLNECITALIHTDAYGFYLRLGKNITYCYTLNRTQCVPQLQKVYDSIYAWTFNTAEYDWHYPNTVDMTLYRKKDIKHDLTSLHYKAPNTCEGSWAGVGHRIMNRKGICYEHSKIVNLPLNKVQTEWSFNRDEHSFSSIELLEIFEQGLKMDILPLHAIDNNAPHIAYNPTFIER